MKINVIVDMDYNTNVLARRLKAMGYTLTNINQQSGIIDAEAATVNLKELRRIRGVRTVTANG